MTLLIFYISLKYFPSTEPSSNPQERLNQSLLFNAFRLSLWQASKVPPIDLGWSLVTSRTLCRACLRLVCIYQTSAWPSFQYGLANLLVEASHVVHDGKLKKGSVARLKSYQANEVKGKKYKLIFHRTTELPNY